MYQNDWMLSKFIEERQHELMRQLEHDRLIRQAELANHPQQHTVYHALDWVGRRLVRWGEYLQARHTRYHRHTLNHNVGG
ncbi:MAG TPA: hypothetical protein VMP08_18595 [Anaerolineae bacterium]|nr:hypothetical protein [Anaerolineae bacterium]